MQLREGREGTANSMTAQAVSQRLQPWPRDCDLQEQGSQDTAELVQGASPVTGCSVGTDVHRWCSMVSLGGKAKNKVPSELCPAVAPRGHITLLHGGGICCVSSCHLIYFVAHKVGQAVSGTRTHENTRGHTLAQGMVHRLWRLLKAEVKSHIKAQSSQSSTVQRHQLPSRERQIVTLIKRF